MLMVLLAMAFILPGEASAQTAKPLEAPAAKLTEINVPDTAPLGAAAIDLGASGYSEREYYADGVANRYRGATLGVLTTAEVIDGNWPYRTRVLVRAPDAKKFNGTLVVEWANVTAGQDIDFAFAESYKYLLSNGYAVAVVSAQRVGVDHLKAWSPNRYGSLTTTVDNIDPKDGSKIDTCGAAPVCPGDALSWDVMTQVAKALKDNAGDQQPLPGLKVEKVIALGESQSAYRLSVYYNTIQPIYGFFDGFTFLDLATQLRSDLPIPAISVNSESTATLFPPTTTSEYVRTWAVAGASHSSLYAANYVDAMVLRDKSIPTPGGPITFSQALASQNCSLMPLFSTVDSGLVLNAALESTNTWIRTGKPAAPSLTFERDAAGALIRDAAGNVQGGIRLGQFVAPTAAMAINGPAAFCVLAGHHREFTSAELKARYGTHEKYVALVSDAMKQAEQQGYILQLDRDEAISAAEKSTVAR
jgi:hypothetical protein